MSLRHTIFRHVNFLPLYKINSNDPISFSIQQYPGDLLPFVKMVSVWSAVTSIIVYDCSQNAALLTCDTRSNQLNDWLLKNKKTGTTSKILELATPALMAVGFCSFYVSSLFPDSHISKPPAYLPVPTSAHCTRSFRDHSAVSVDCLQRHGMFCESPPSPQNAYLVRQGSNASYLSTTSADMNMDSVASGTAALIDLYDNILC